jgi:hypothetical protein
MYAWRRVDVAELNRRGREAWRSLDRLHGEELLAPGGTPYAVGDRVVALAPGAGGSVVTSETGTVVALEVGPVPSSCAWTTAATCAGWRPMRWPPTAWHTPTR